MTRGAIVRKTTAGQHRGPRHPEHPVHHALRQRHRPGRRQNPRIPAPRDRELRVQAPQHGPVVPPHAAGPVPEHERPRVVEPPVRRRVVVNPLGNGQPVQAHGPDGLAVQADGLQVRERQAHEGDRAALPLETALEPRVLVVEAPGPVEIAGHPGDGRRAAGHVACCVDLERLGGLEDGIEDLDCVERRLDDHGDHQLAVGCQVRVARCWWEAVLDVFGALEGEEVAVVGEGYFIEVRQWEPRGRCLRGFISHGDGDRLVW